MLNRRDLSTVSLHPLGKPTIYFYPLFPIFNLLIISAKTFPLISWQLNFSNSLSNLVSCLWKSKPSLSSRPLLPMCMWTPSKNSSRLVERVGSSPKQFSFFLCLLILLGQMLDSVIYSTLDPIKKTLPSFDEQSWLQTTARSSP